MKPTLFAFIIVSTSLLTANDMQTNTTSKINKNVTNAIARVEDARAETLSTLKSIIRTVETAREKYTNKKDNNYSISTQIIQTHALSEIARNTASVEIAKAMATARITQAIDKLNSNSLATIANAIASVEIAKAKAKKNIAKVTGAVEISKVKQPTHIKHAQETLTIAKNVSAIQIAQSVAQVEVAKAVSLLDIARSSIESALPKSPQQPIQKDQEKLEDIKAKATANISSYLAQIEVMKANMLAKIAKEVAKVEIAKLHENNTKHNKEQNCTTYPKTLIKAN